jgi:hypothetical protein
MKYNFICNITIIIFLYIIVNIYIYIYIILKQTIQQLLQNGGSHSTLLFTYDVKSI